MTSVRRGRAPLAAWRCLASGYLAILAGTASVP